MNAQTKIVKSETVEAKKPASSQPEKFDINDAHILRSKFIDSYAKVEIWAARYSASLNLNGKNLSERIAKIRSSNCANHKKMTALLDELIPLTDFRGEFAHAVMQTDKIVGKDVILYQCPNLIGHSITENFGHLCPEKLKEITKRLHSIANSLSGLSGLTK